MKSGRGGKREGAGRPSKFKSRPLVRMLIPLKFVEEVEKFILEKEAEEESRGNLKKDNNQKFFSIGVYRIKPKIKIFAIDNGCFRNLQPH